MSIVIYVNPDKQAVEQYQFFCPGCNCTHGFKTRGQAPNWDFNGNLELPTVNPAMYFRLGTRGVCRFKIVNGQLVYNPASTHAYSGQTVDMVAV